MDDSMRYRPAKALLACATPRNVTVTITRKAHGGWLTTIPESDLGYLVALEWQRQTRFPGFGLRKLRGPKARLSQTTRTKTKQK